MQPPTTPNSNYSAASQLEQAIHHRDQLKEELENLLFRVQEYNNQCQVRQDELSAMIGAMESVIKALKPWGPADAVPDPGPGRAIVVDPTEKAHS